MKNEWIMKDIKNGSGMVFIDKNGRSIRIEINSNTPEYITIQGDDRIVVQPWATNMIRIKHAD